jgi:hypothetical protein
MGKTRKSLNTPPVTDPWVDSRWIAEKYSVHRDTGRRWIVLLTQKYLTYTDGRFKRGPHARLRRIPLSILEEHINELLN